VIPFPARRRRTETDPGLRRYMLEVYDYVACGLAVTGFAAYIVMVSGFHATMMDQTPPFLLPFMWILLLAPLALVMLLWLSIDEMGFFAAQATVWACSALTGFTFGCISLVYTGTSLAPVSFIAAGTFFAMSVYGYFTRTDLSKSGHFLGMGVVGVILAGLVYIFLASTAMQFALSAIGVIALVGLTAWDTQRIKELYVERDGDEVINKKALVGALALYFDANPVVLLLRLEILFANRRNE
jgi:FtsH-binding integral membrane protein